MRRETSSKAVVVTTGSRLHAGFYYIKSHNEDWGVAMAGAGFYIANPRVVIEARFCENIELLNFDEISQILEETLRVQDLKACIRLVEGIPRHRGLGSTTQTILATLVAASLVNNGDVSIDKVIELSGRSSKYSSIGSLLFKYGGFVVEHGVPAASPPFEPLIRLRIPEDWRFIVIIPSLRRGLNELEEESIMSNLIGKKLDLEAKYLMVKGCMMMSSGIARKDLKTTLEGLYAIQKGTGLVFSDYQGGVFRSDLYVLVEILRKHGIILAQSSWGPTLYTITHADLAQRVKSEIENQMEKLGVDGEVLIAPPRNKGYEVEIVDHD